MCIENFSHRVEAAQQPVDCAPEEPTEETTETSEPEPVEERELVEV